MRRFILGRFLVDDVKREIERSYQARFIVKLQQDLPTLYRHPDGSLRPADQFWSSVGQWYGRKS